MRIEGNVVIYEGGARQRTKSDVCVIRCTLAGGADRKLARNIGRRFGHTASTLRRLLEPTADAWRLAVDAGAARSFKRDAVAKVVLMGAGNDIGNIEIVEANGDLTLMQLTPLLYTSAKNESSCRAMGHLAARCIGVRCDRRARDHRH